MVIKNVLSATPGSLNTRATASFRSILLVSKAANFLATLFTSRVILGGLPNKTDKSISTGLLSKKASLTVKWRSSVA